MSVTKKSSPAMMSLPIDPAIKSNIEIDPAYGKIKRSKTMTAAQRRKAEYDANRIKATYDIPMKLKTAVETLSKQYSVPYSQIASLLLIHALNALAKGEIDIEQYLTHCYSPRYDFKIELPEVPNIEE